MRDVDVGVPKAGGQSWWSNRAFDRKETPDVDLTGCVLYLPLYHPELTGSSFTDKGPRRLTCTVTGATWGNQGRTFGGVAGDHIDAGKASAFQDLAAFTWSVWVDFTASGAVAYPMAKRHYKSIRINLHTDNTFWFQLSNTDLTSFSSRSIETITIDEWVMLTVTYDDAGDRKPYLYINGAECTYSLQQALTGTVALEADATDGKLTIGAYSTTEVTISGLVGEALLYDRVLSKARIEQNYAATRWRYE